jgi:hypothetical protein
MCPVRITVGAFPALAFRVLMTYFAGGAYCAKNLYF